jgi:hypothetical protein
MTYKGDAHLVLTARSGAADQHFGRHRTAHDRSLAGDGTDRKLTPDRDKAVVNVRQPLAAYRTRRVETLAIVSDLEQEPAVADYGDLDGGGATGMLDGILNRLQTGEIDRALDFGRIPADALTLDVGGQRHTQRDST